MNDFDTVLDRPMPQAHDFERAILGSLLIDRRALHRVADIVTPESFFRDDHRAIYKTMLELDADGVEIELLTVKDRLATRPGNISAAYISSLCDGIPDIANVERYARVLASKAKLRSIITSCNDGMRRALEAVESPEMISSELASTMHNLAAVGDRESRPMYDVMLDVEDRAKKLAEEGRTRAVLTGFPSLDYHRAIRRKALIVIGAPTSHGKTTFMLNLAVGAVETDVAVSAAVYSLEMSAEDVKDPVLSMLSGVRLQNIQDDLLDEYEKRQLAAARDKLLQLRSSFFFADRIRDVDTLYADCRKRKLTRGLDLVLIDYLQLVRGFDDERTREQEVDRIARHLLLLSQELDCAVVTGSQVNKERLKRGNGRLSVEDLAYGKVIGEHARVVLLFQRPRQDDKSKSDIPWCQTIFQMEKNSGRRTGDIPMHADLAVQRFAEGSCRDNNCRYVVTKDEPKEQDLFEQRR